MLFEINVDTNNPIFFFWHLSVSVSLWVPFEWEGGWVGKKQTNKPPHLLMFFLLIVWRRGGVDFSRNGLDPSNFANDRPQIWKPTFSKKVLSTSKNFDQVPPQHTQQWRPFETRWTHIVLAGYNRGKLPICVSTFCRIGLGPEVANPPKPLLWVL